MLTRFKYIRTLTHMHICTHSFTHTHTHTHTRTHVCKRNRACLLATSSRQIHMHAHSHAHAHMRSYTQTQARPYTWECTHTFTNSLIHTYIRVTRKPYAHWDGATPRAMAWCKMKKKQHNCSWARQNSDFQKDSLTSVSLYIHKYTHKNRQPDCHTRMHAHMLLQPRWKSDCDCSSMCACMRVWMHWNSDCEKRILILLHFQM